MSEQTTTTGRTGRLATFLPIVGWLPSYRRADGTADLRAGATVGVLVVPQAMAYAALAGVPPIAGLYAAMVSLVVYAVFGTSRFISVGPVAIDSLLTAAAVAPLADGDSGRYVALTALLTLMIGVMQVGAGLARLGALVNLLSVPVIAGFTSAAALTIGLTQVKDLLGLDLSGSSTSFLEAMGSVVPALSSLDPVTTTLGAASLVALVALKRWAPRVPGPLLLVAVATVLVVVLDLPVTQIGEIPSGIPLPSWPGGVWADVTALLPAAAAIALISYMESISTASAFARRTRTRIDPDQELVAVGLANGSAGLMQGMPVAGGFSRGAVNFNAGARTPLSGVVAAVLVAISLLFLTPLLAQIPKAVLAAIILAAVGSLVDVKGARAVGRIRRSDLAALLATALATLALGPTWGLAVGVGVSFALFLRHLNRPHMPELGFSPEQGVFRNVRRHDDVVTHPEVLVVRIDAPLSFVGARAIADDLAERLRERPGVRFLVLDATAITAADFTGVEMLGELVTDLGETGVELWLGGARGPVRDVLSRADWYAALEEQGRSRGTVVEVVRALPLDAGSPAGWPLPAGAQPGPVTSTW
ncbi:SulP family inorganic anion transporter [Nocardioides sp. GCM10027113]|uniref:SulP family inorganic anion transporter n=1 Tax=unclassified Nocardioides TaxID=2615069 RepID=UPI003623BADE